MGCKLEGPSDYPIVTRRARALAGATSEPFETLRDALNLESRLRMHPPDPWRPEKQTATERSWTARGHVVRLRTPSVLADWTLTVDGQPVLEDVSRKRAFETAASRMREISERVPVGERNASR